jgi:hypothetical protein
MAGFGDRGVETSGSAKLVELFLKKMRTQRYKSELITHSPFRKR